jgi:hypothetical protein
MKMIRSSLQHYIDTLTARLNWTRGKTLIPYEEVLSLQGYAMEIIRMLKDTPKEITQLNGIQKDLIEELFYLKTFVDKTHAKSWTKTDEEALQDFSNQAKELGFSEEQIEKLIN